MKSTWLKRTLAGVAAFTMLFAMTACGEKTEKKDTAEEETEVTTTTAEETPAPTAPVEEETTPSEEETTPPEDEETPAPAEDEVAPYLVDVTALTVLEAKQTMAVEVTGYEIAEDVDELVGVNGNDELRISVVNNSYYTVSKVSFYVAAYDENNALVSVQKAVELFDEEVMAFTSGELEMNPGDEETFALKCRAERFSDVKLIVSDYTTADGIVVENSIAAEWIESAVVANPEYK